FALAQDKHANIPKVIPIAMLLLVLGFLLCFFVARKHAPVRLVPTKIDRENVRITFFNHVYAERFVAANKETARTINPWKYGQSCAASNSAIALRLQSTLLVGRFAERLSLSFIARMAEPTEIPLKCW